MGFSRQVYWSGLPFPSPGDLPDPGIKPGSPALQADTLPSEPPWKPPRREGSGILKEEERTNFFFPHSTFLSLSHINFFFFKPGIDDYTTNNSV